MKLSEILLEAINTPAHPTKTTMGRVTAAMLNRQGRTETSPERIGRGAYGSVFDQPNADVDHVLKISRSSGTSNEEPDGYASYIERILNLHNPYFPQIGEFKVLRNRDTGRDMYKTRIETLAPLQTLTDQEVQMLWKRIFGDHTRRTTIDRSDRDSALDYIMQVIRAAVAGYDMDGYWVDVDNIADPSFIEALNVIRQIKNDDPEHELGSDIHYGNVMVRRTKYGPQLVITDPFV